MFAYGYAYAMSKNALQDNIIEKWFPFIEYFEYTIL